MADEIDDEDAWEELLVWAGARPATGDRTAAEAIPPPAEAPEEVEREALPTATAPASEDPGWSAAIAWAKATVADPAPPTRVVGALAPPSDVPPWPPHPRIRPTFFARPRPIARSVSTLALRIAQLQPRPAPPRQDAEPPQEAPPIADVWAVALQRAKARTDHESGTLGGLANPHEKGLFS